MDMEHLHPNFYTPQLAEWRPVGAPVDKNTLLSFKVSKKDSENANFYLGGGFKHFLFSPLLGEDSHFD